jgi:hypothetical protein
LDERNIPGQKILLFPFYARFIGAVLLLTGIIAGYLYFLGGKPPIFETNVFALVSVYVETRYFVIIRTNLLDEIAAIAIVTGLVFISFSKEKHEKEEYQAFRLKALIKAVYSSIVLWILLFLLFYGYIIFMAAPMTFLCFFIFYNIFFRYYLLTRG